MVDPELTISIDRASLGLAPLVLSGRDDGTTWGLVGYSEPAWQARIGYATDSPYVAGSAATSATWQQSILGFDAAPDVHSELELRVAIAELRVALSQFTYPTTVSLLDFSETWRCDMGSISATPRDYTDLANFDPVFSVTIPVQPIPET